MCTSDSCSSVRIPESISYQRCSYNMDSSSRLRLQLWLRLADPAISSSYYTIARVYTQDTCRGFDSIAIIPPAALLGLTTPAEVSTPLQRDRATADIDNPDVSQHPSRFRPHCNRGDVMRFYVQHRLAVLTSLARSDQFSRPGIIAMSAVEPCRPDERALTHQFIFSVLTSVAGGRSSAV